MRLVGLNSSAPTLDYLCDRVTPSSVIRKHIHRRNCKFQCGQAGAGAGGFYVLSLHK